MDKLKKRLFEEVSQLYDDLKSLKVRTQECPNCPFKITCYQRFCALYDLLESAGLEDEYDQWQQRRK